MVSECVSGVCVRKVKTGRTEDRGDRKDNRQVIDVVKGMGDGGNEVERKSEVDVNGDGKDSKDMREGKGGGVEVGEGEVREREWARGRTCVSSCSRVRLKGTSAHARKK